MDNKTWVIIGLVAVLIIVGVYQFAKPSVTGNVVNTEGDKVINSETKEAPLTQESKVISNVDYEVKVNDKITGRALGNAEVYLDGKLVGKTSSDGKFTILDVGIGKHNLRATYAGEESDVITKDITLTDKSTVIYLISPRTIVLTLTDKETKRPVENVKVFLQMPNGDAKFNPITTDNWGKAQFNNVLPRDYVARVEDYPNMKPSELITIGASDEVTAMVDMPNPRFRGSSMKCEQKWRFLEGTYGVCTVTLVNNGDIGSESTTVVLRIYKKEGEEFVKIGGETLLFGNILKGESLSLTTKEHTEFSGSYEEYVVAAVYEGWKYTPDDASQLDEATIPQSLMDKFVTNTAEWCSNDIQRCGETAAGVGKAVVGIIGYLV